MTQLGLCYESIARKPGWRFTGRRKCFNENCKGFCLRILILHLVWYVLTNFIQIFKWKCKSLKKSIPAENSLGDQIWQNFAIFKNALKWTMSGLQNIIAVLDNIFGNKWNILPTKETWSGRRFFVCSRCCWGVFLFCPGFLSSFLGFVLPALLYESPARKPGWRFTARRKYGSTGS